MALQDIERDWCLLSNIKLYSRTISERRKFDVSMWWNIFCQGMSELFEKNVNIFNRNILVGLTIRVEQQRNCFIKHFILSSQGHNNTFSSNSFCLSINLIKFESHFSLWNHVKIFCQIRQNFVIKQKLFSDVSTNCMITPGEVLCCLEVDCPVDQIKHHEWERKQ